MALSEWQARLRAHFLALKNVRAAAALGVPVFGLEHGLSEVETGELEQDIRVAARAGMYSRNDRLAWIVYSSEVGYRYAGEEYWQTFCRVTPGWDSIKGPEWLSDQFESFAKEFDGARPSGTWAKQFRFISWPITHAILPEDLQQQLGEILYLMRNDFSADLLSSPDELGLQIASRKGGAGSRFRNLVENHRLVGQIATALLTRGETGFDGLIDARTLQRIATSLESSTSDARTKLRGAQQSARLFLKGLAPVRKIHSENSSNNQIGRTSALAMEPRVLLRPVGRNSWSVALEIPDLSHLLNRFPTLEPALSESPCEVFGATTGRPLPRGALLRGPVTVPIRRWPGPDDALLRFLASKIPAGFESLMKTEFRLRPGPLWLFRIAEDQLAYEVRGKSVRAGSRYLLARRTPLEKPWLKGLALDCDGLFAAAFDLPDAVDSRWISQLGEFGLEPTRRIEVWPAGLPPALFDDNGRAEWLVSERPILAIRTDHEVETLSVTLLSDAVKLPTFPIEKPRPGKPVFLELPALPRGRHLLHVQGKSSDKGELEIVIRDRRRWVPGANSSGLLAVEVDPPRPNLDDLWEGRVALSVYGPVERQLSASVSLIGSGEELCSQRIPTVSLPIRADHWRALFEKSVAGVAEFRDNYDAADACRVDINGDELGTFSLLCEREFTPLRWIVRRIKKAYELTLVDDSGTDAELVVDRFDFETPDVPVRCDVRRMVEGEPISMGGLFVARSGELVKSVIVPRPSRSMAIEEWKLAPRIAPREAMPRAARELLELISLWNGARRAAFFEETKRRAAVGALHTELLRIVCGERWVVEEKRFSQGALNVRIQGLKQAIGDQRFEKSLAAVLMNEYVKLSDSSREARIRRLTQLSVQFLRLPTPVQKKPGAIRHGDIILREAAERSPGDPGWLAEFALTLADAPGDLLAWSGGDCEKGFELLAKSRVLARSARFLAVVAERRHADGASTRAGGRP